MTYEPATAGCVYVYDWPSDWIFLLEEIFEHMDEMVEC